MFNRLIKKLDLLIIKAFIGPFIATFFITLFVLVLQFFWLYIDDIVGKGVDLLTVGRLIMYVGATLVPLALPLAVLLSSIMTFGNLGETFELIAIKSAGIPLLRFMRPLLLISLVICYVAFLFNNNIIPIANLRMNTLKYDIIISKPAFDIKEGVFYDKIEGYVIKIGKKDKDDSTIHAVVIYEQDFQGLQDHIIVAEKGKMLVTPDKHSLQFVLQNGCIYQEGKGDRSSTATEFIRMGFKEYKKILDLTSFKLNRTDDSAFRNNYQMLSLHQLGKNIDSIEKLNAAYRKKASTDLGTGLKFSQYLDTTGWTEIEKNPGIRSKYLLAKPTAPYVAPDTARPVAAVLPATATAAPRPATDTGSPTAAAIAAAKEKARVLASKNGPVTAQNAKPTTQNKKPTTKNQQQKTSPPPVFKDYLPDSVRTTVLDRTISQINSVKINLDQPALLFENEQNDLRIHLIAWHEKLTLSVACLVMFLIGAPLGSIIRKGGIGMPLVIAVIFFVIFFLLNNFGKKFVKQDVLTPIAGMWLATYVLTPIGLFLIYKAVQDSQLFNKEFYFRTIRAIRAFLQRRNQKPKTSNQ